MNDTPIHSPEQSIRAESGAHQQVVKVEMPIPGWLMPAVIGVCILLAATVIVSAVLWSKYDDLRNTVEVKTRLNSYNLDEFERMSFGPLRAEVAENHDLIQTYGIGKTCRRAKK